MTKQFDYNIQQLVLAVFGLLLGIGVLSLQLLIGDEPRYGLIGVCAFMIIYLALKIVRHIRRTRS